MANLILASFEPAIIALIVLVALIFIGALVFIFFKTRHKKEENGEALPAEQVTDEEKPQEVEPVEEVREEAAEEVTEEVTEEPAPEAAQEQPVQEVAEEQPEEQPEEAAEEVAEEVSEEPQPEETAEAAEEPQPEETAEVSEEAQPEETAEAAEEPQPEVTEEAAEEVEPETVIEEVSEEAKSEEVKASVLPADEDEPDTAEDDNDTDDDAPVRSVARTDGHVRYIIIKYNKSFTAKLIQSADGVKDYYSKIKNELLSYKGVKSRISWKYESFTAGRTTLAKIAVRGKNLSLYLALDPKKYADTKYVIDDKSEVAAYEKTPLLYRIKNDRRLNYSKELIEAVMEGREKQEGFKPKNYAKEYPYEKIEPLVERELVKVLTEEDAQSGDVFKPRDMVMASEVNELMRDEVAAALIEETDEVSDRTKQSIVNIDTLSRHFADGETADLEAMKKRIPKFAKSTTYVKVLARGTLDKKLTVIADSFSIEAAKMIILTGGNAVKKKNS